MGVPGLPEAPGNPKVPWSGSPAAAVVIFPLAHSPWTAALEEKNFLVEEN